MRIRPVNFTWTDEGVMRPDPRFRRLCDHQFVVGIEYSLAPIEARTRKSHNHYFATLHDIWLNLPEDHGRRFPTEEHMRAWALVEAGYATEKVVVCDTKKDAQRLAAFARREKPFSVIIVSGPVVKIFDPMSQSGQAMGREVFQDSKTKVLDVCSALTATPREAFEREAAERVPPERKRT